MLINCDLGEELSPNPDPAVMPYIDLANIACSGHAGNQYTILHTLELAQPHAVKIGAHPSYPDKTNFGRLPLDMPWQDLAHSLLEQSKLLEEACVEQDQQLHHIKPHGALYLKIMQDITLYEQLLQWMQTHFPNLPLMIQSGIQTQTYQTLAEGYQVPLILEAFADRAYQADGTLAPRSQVNSLYHDSERIVEQSQRFINQAYADTLCFHSDNPASVQALQQLAKLKQAQL